jgi:hypothetical protein
MLVRADTGGATHALVDHLRERGVRFSVSLPADERVRVAVLAVPAGACSPRSTPAASHARAPRSPSWRPSILPAGRRAPGRSAGARIPTQASRSTRPPSPSTLPPSTAPPPPHEKPRLAAHAFSAARWPASTKSSRRTNLHVSRTVLQLRQWEFAPAGSDGSDDGNAPGVRSFESGPGPARTLLPPNPDVCAPDLASKPPATRPHNTTGCTVSLRSHPPVGLPRSDGQG